MAVAVSPHKAKQNVTPREITFHNGKKVPLSPGGQMLFRSEAMKRKVMADL
jgi:hypothetical protein